MSNLPAPVQITSEEDHRRMMRLLGIPALRPGPSGDPHAPNAANADEAKANPYPELPDPLMLKDGRAVTTEELWWNVRRPELVEDFNREIYGRLPENLPRVSWEATSTTRETTGDVLVITKHLVGHVDNAAYPHITVDIQLTVTTPATASGPVPVMMSFGFEPRPGGASSRRGGRSPDRVVVSHEDDAARRTNVAGLPYNRINSGYRGRWHGYACRKERLRMLNLNSVMLGTTQPKALATFYEQVIGKPADMVDSEHAFYGWQVGSAYLSILEHSEMGGNAKDPGRVILNFETSEVQEEFERIKALGSAVIKAPYEMGGGWIATLADPDGNYFQLVSPMG